ncbi:MAG: hypothetical protein HY054_11340 [Proteobacteria bacterium]|nr:hypothetical protein [Pseudomonadota bacterium]
MQQTDGGSGVFVLLLVGVAGIAALLGGMWWVADYSSKRFQYPVFLNPINFLTFIGLALIVAGGVALAPQAPQQPETAAAESVAAPASAPSSQPTHPQPHEASSANASAEDQDADLPDAAVLTADDYQRMNCRELNGDTWCRTADGSMTNRGHVVIAGSSDKGEGGQ